MTDLHLARTVRTAVATGNALLVDGGVVTAVGTREEVDRLTRIDNTFDHGHAVITPGIRDAHFHPVSYAAVVNGIGLKDAHDLDEVFDRLATAAASLGDDVPLLAHRIDDETLAEHRLPTAVELDRVTGDRPALVMRYCGHVAIANTVALRMAGIDVGSTDPDDGIIDRDRNGAPTGVLREGAVDLVSAKLGRTGPVSPGDLQRAMLALAGLGITSIGAMVRSSYGPLGGLGDELGLLIGIAERLPLRVHVYVIAASEDELAEATKSIGEPSARLVWQGFKAFADGSFGGHTAAMFESYTDDDTTGTLLLSSTDRALARSTIARGGDVALHAIGDRAGGAVLDFFAELIGVGVAPERLRMEHVSVLTSADLTRMGAMGVGGAVQPAFLHTEVDWIEGRVGSERLRRTYAFRSLLEAGVLLRGQLRLSCRATRSVGRDRLRPASRGHRANRGVEPRAGVCVVHIGRGGPPR